MAGSPRGVGAAYVVAIAGPSIVTSTCHMSSFCTIFCIFSCMQIDFQGHVELGEL